MTYLGRFVTLTAGDLRSKLQIYLSRSKSISVDPAWPEEHTGVKIILGSVCSSEVIDKKRFPLKT